MCSSDEANRNFVDVWGILPYLDTVMYIVMTHLDIVF